VDRTCVVCSETFQIERKRGRPHTKCESCRIGKPWTGSVKTVKSPTKTTTSSAPPVVEPKRKFKDEPTRGNARYSRTALIEKLEGMDFSTRPISSKIAELIRGLP